MKLLEVPFRSEHAADNGFGPRAGFEPFDVSRAEQSIPQRFLEVAGRFHTAVAVVDANRAITYGELLRRATRVAAALSHRLATRPGPIALQLPSEITAIEALFGVLFAGRSYFFIPMDTGTSAMSDMLAAVAPAALIVTEGKTPPGADQIGHVAHPTIAAGTLARSQDTGPLLATPRIEPGDLACLFATSGTTGAPKIVGLSHRAVLFDTGRQVNDLQLGPDDRIDLLSHPSFSASLASIFTALLTGAQLHILNAREHLSTLGAWLTRSDITISTMTVSTLRTLCATLPAGGAPPTLRLISVGGEPLLAKDVQVFFTTFPPPCVLQNAMASTETRTYAQYFVPRGLPHDGAMPIGWPVFGKEVQVLGEDGLPVLAGQVGQITVRSRYLANGYINSPSLTAERFLAQPDGSVLFLTGDRASVRDDGCLVFHGRADSLVKIRGYRVEPSAVEEALTRVDQVRQAAVIVRESLGGEPYLTAFVVPEPRAAMTSRQVLEAVADRLPAFAVPSTLVLLDSLPMTNNGKVDYAALRSRPAEETQMLAGSHTREDILATLRQIWSEALGHPNFGTDHSFFELGGDSLNAIGVQVHVQRLFGIDLPLEVLVRHPSMNSLAAWLTSVTTGEGDLAALMQLHPGGVGVPLFCVPGIGGEPLGCRPLANRVGAERPVYGIRTTAAFDRPGQDTSIEALAAAQLRAIDSVITPDTPVMLCGHSFGAIIAFEIAHQLKAAGRPLGLLAVIDMPLDGRGPWWRWIGGMLTNVPAWLRYDALETDWATLASRGAGKAALLWRRAIRPVTAAPDFRAYFGKQRVPLEMQERLIARLQLLNRYRMRPLPAPIVLFRARAQAVFGRNDRHLGWNRLASTVDVCDVPGHHESCAGEPYVARMAEFLSARMRAVTPPHVSQRR